MKHSIVRSAAVLLLGFSVSGQLYAQQQESTVPCSDLRFTSAVTDVLPNASDACLGVVEKDGRLFAEFKAEVVRNRAGTLRARLRRADGSWTGAYDFTPDMSRRINVGGRSVQIRDLQRGQQLNVFLPPDRFEIAVADDDDVTTVPATIVLLMVRRAPTEVAMLPSTAGPVPMFGLLGAVFVLLGSGLALLRRRIDR